VTVPRYQHLWCSSSRTLFIVFLRPSAIQQQSDDQFKDFEGYLGSPSAINLSQTKSRII